MQCLRDLCRESLVKLVGPLLIPCVLLLQKLLTTHKWIIGKNVVKIGTRDRHFQENGLMVLPCLSHRRLHALMDGDDIGAVDALVKQTSRKRKRMHA